MALGLQEQAPAAGSPPGDQPLEGGRVPACQQLGHKNAEHWGSSPPCRSGMGSRAGAARPEVKNLKTYNGNRLKGRFVSFPGSKFLTPPECLEMDQKPKHQDPPQTVTPGSVCVGKGAQENTSGSAELPPFMPQAVAPKHKGNFK